MGGVEFAIDNNSGVEMDDRPAFFAFPFADKFTRGFLVFADGAIGNNIDMLRINGDALARLGGAEARDFFQLAGGLLCNHAACGENEQQAYASVDEHDYFPARLVSIV